MITKVKFEQIKVIFYKQFKIISFGIIVFLRFFSSGISNIKKFDKLSLLNSKFDNRQIFQISKKKNSNLILA